MTESIAMPEYHLIEQSLVLIGARADKPLLQVSALREVPANATAVHVAETGIDRLSPLIQPILSAAITAEAASSNLMHVVVDGTLARAADNDGYRAFVRSSNGAFKEHARLFEPERLQNLVNAAAMFQIASVIVAQQHLADISQKLDEIKKGVEGIARFLDQERKSKITGTLKSLVSVIEALRKGEDLTRILPLLNQVVHEMGSIADHLVAELEALTQQVQEFEAPGFLDTTKPLTEKILKAQEAASSTFQQWKLCVSAHWLALSAIRQIEGESVLQVSRERQLHDEADAFLSLGGPLERFEAAVALRINTLTSLRDSRTALQVNRIALQKWLEQVLPADRQQARGQIEQAQALLLEREEKVTLTLEMRDGVCVAAYRP